MEFLIENWYIILAAMALGALAVVAVVRFFRLPREKQMENVRQWLLGAVTAAEKELGGGTGKLKLRQVYDAFLTKFPWLAPVVPFEQFSGLVDDALKEMRKLLADNKAVQQLVTGEDGTNGTAEAEAEAQI